MSDGSEAKLEGQAGVAAYQVDHATGRLEGRFVLALYDGDVACEDGTKVKGSGPDGSIEGVYDVTTYKPGGGVFATGTLQLTPVKDQGAYAVIWVLHPDAEAQKPPYNLPPEMVYDGCALALGDSQFVIGWDNNDYRTHLTRLVRLR